MRIAILPFLILGLLFLPAPTRGTILEDIWRSSDDGWIDVDLTITSVVDEGDYIGVVGMGLFEGSEVGLKVSFLKGMKPGFPNAQPDRSAFAHRGIVYSSIGKASDRLLHAVATLYGVSEPAGGFASSVEATAIALEQFPLVLNERPANFKVFFGDGVGHENEYAELYTNVDIPAKRLELHEKDAEYRANVVRALSAQ